MKSLNFNIQDMGIDINDVKILIKACFQYLMKTCYQWAKEHPLISCVLSFFYLLYIFWPSLFSILFYTFPLVICFAILLGGTRFSFDNNHCNSMKNNNVAKTSNNFCDFTSIDHSNNNNHRRPYLLHTQMSKRTITFTGLDKNSSNNDENTKIICRENSPSHSDTESSSQSEEDEAKDEEKNKGVVEWTEDDQRNLMDLGSSEIERNKRLESLIAKRRARKMFSMQPRRNTLYSFDQHDQIDNQVMGSILVSRDGIDHNNNAVDHQPGSAPSVLLPTRNPFDLPYDPHEEKPVLTGGSFDEEFSDEQQHYYTDFLKDNNNNYINLCTNNLRISFVTDFKDNDHLLPRVVSDKPQLPTKESEDVIDQIEELSIRQGKSNQTQNDNDDEAFPSQRPGEEDHQYFENPFAINNEINDSKHLVSLQETVIKENGLGTPVNEEEQILYIQSKKTNSTRDEVKETQHHVVLSDNSDYKGRIDDDDETDSSSSTYSVETRSRFNATKNEAFRNSVKKVLTCLAAFPRNKGVMPRCDSQDLLACDSSPSNVIPTKMQERSFYTKPHYTNTLTTALSGSIASDLQVEVSESGSPPIAAIEVSSPTDQESYDGDVDKDVNSVDDEELWGISPHLTKLKEFGMNFKLNNDGLTEVNRTSNLGENVHNINSSDTNESDPPHHTMMLGEVEEGGGGGGGVDEQTTIRRVVSSLSPRSILPNEGKEKVLEVDLHSTNGDIMGSLSSSSPSSSSGSLTSQMQSKAEYLAEYLANLPPTSECGSNILEDVERSSVVREPSVEKKIDDEINPIFGNDENKEDSKESKYLIESQGSCEESTLRSKIEALKETSLTSTHAYELSKEHLDQAPSIAEQNDQLGRIEDAGSPSMENENEVNYSPKKSISDSNSTNCQEDVYDQLRLEENMKIRLQNQVQSEVNKDESQSSNQIIQDDESTSGEANSNEIGQSNTP